MPRFSIITPVYDPPRGAFEECVRSVREQTFDDWEWCLANDASPAGWVSARLRELQREDPRIRVVDRTVNGGIVAASNDAIALSDGEFLVLLDNDDELSREALARVDAAIVRHPDADYIYSDEDKITDTGDHFDEFKKPDWSPERLLAQNYTSHLSVLRRETVERAGRFRPGFDGSQDYDLVLRVTERARRVVHVPHTLYHWRALPTSTASTAAAKPYAFVAALTALDGHLARRGTEADVDEAVPSVARVRRRVVRRPEVTIVLPVDDSRRTVFGFDTTMSTNAVRSLSRRTSYANHRTVLVAAEGTDDGLVASLAGRLDGPVTVVRTPDGANRAAMFNAGLVACETRRAVLFDQRCEVVDEDWLQTLVGYEDRDGVAMVAPVVLDTGGGIVSAGLAVSPEPHDIGRGCRHDDPGPLGMLAIARECTGVATYCALVDVPALKSVGALGTGFDGRYVDFDLARKLHSFGLHAIVTPLARVRLNGDDATRNERAAYDARWSWFPLADPYSPTDTRSRFGGADGSLG